VTNDEITKLVVAELGLQDIDAYDETAFVNTWVYQGILDLLSRTRCVVRCVQLRVKANEDQYVLDHGILALVDVENGARRRARRDETTIECGDTAFTLIRSDLLVVKPIPSEDGTIQVWAVMRPSKMAAPTDSPSDEAYGAIPDEYHDAIVTYALWKGSSYGDDASGQQGERYRMLYEGADGRGGRLAQIKSLVNLRGTARGPRRRVNLRPLSPSGYFTG
jgi:hypothetical protein